MSQSSRFALIAALAVVGAAPLFCASSARAQEPVIAPPGTPAAPVATQDDPVASSDEPRRKFSFGPEFGAYFPNSGKARDAFGDVWYNYGFGFGTIQTADQKGQLRFDLNILSARRGGSYAYLAPVGVSYRQALGKSRSAVPYVGVSADLVPTLIRAGNYGVDSKLRLSVGASAFVGYTFSERAYIQARYYGISESAGFQLSGFGLSTGFRF